MNKINVYIVDDHKLILEGLKAMLLKEESIAVLGTALDAITCHKEILNLDIDVLFLDINLGEVNGYDLCKEIKQKRPALKIIGLSSFTAGSFIAKMLDSGAHGYLYKNATMEEIYLAIRVVLKSEIYLSTEAKRNYDDFKLQQKSQPILTKREIEILKLIKQGITNQDIAKLLFISIDTVDTHRKNLYAKLEVKNTAQLIEKALHLIEFSTF